MASGGEHITQPSELPSAFRYVLMRDDFLSNWGQAEGKDCMYIYACETHAEAEIVKANGKARGDQSRISIQPRTHFSEFREFPDGWYVMLATRETMPVWYEPGAFNTEPCPACGGQGCRKCDDIGRVRKVRTPR